MNHIRTHTKFIYMDENPNKHTDKSNYIITNTNNIIINDIIIFIKNQYKRLADIYHPDEHFESKLFVSTYKEDMKYSKILVDIFCNIFHILYQNREILLKHYSPDSKCIYLKTFQFEPNSHLDLTFDIKITTLKKWKSILLEFFNSYYKHSNEYDFNDPATYPEFMNRILDAYDVGSQFIKYMDKNTFVNLCK